MKKILFYFLLLVSNDVMSQGTHAQTKIAPFFLFDTYYSFIGNRGADVWGFKAGITWNNKWKFGAGFNKIKSDIVEEKALPSDEVGYSIDDTVRSQLYLRYYPLMAEYTFYEKDDWQISSPLCLGCPCHVHQTGYCERVLLGCSLRSLFFLGLYLIGRLDG
jgi:hypothetical protein